MQGILALQNGSISAGNDWYPDLQNKNNGIGIYKFFKQVDKIFLNKKNYVHYLSYLIAGYILKNDNIRILNMLSQQFNQRKKSQSIFLIDNKIQPSLAIINLCIQTIPHLQFKERFPIKVHCRQSPPQLLTKILQNLCR